MQVFTSHTRLAVGDSSRTRFWHDLWFSGRALNEAFQEVYNIACAQEASVADLFEFSGGFPQWNVFILE